MKPKYLVRSISLATVFTGCLFVNNTVGIQSVEASSSSNLYSEIHTPVENQDATTILSGHQIDNPNWSTTSTNIVANSTSYNDFDEKAYWAKDIKWMIDEGLITGYKNQKHPTTGKWGSWLDPGGALTEYQLLSILLRYKLGVDTYMSIKEELKPQTTFIAYPDYYTSEKIGIITKGSTTNKNYYNKQVTRGQLAQSLVSMHYGQAVTLNEAIQFLYSNKITSGTDVSKGATIENFQPSAKLTRSQISSFLKRYHNQFLSNTIVDLPRLAKGNAEIVSKKYIVNIHKIQLIRRVSEVKGNNGYVLLGDYSKNEKDVKEYGSGDYWISAVDTGEGILVSHKYHTYNVNTQSEYDAVLDYVTENLEKEFHPVVAEQLRKDNSDMAENLKKFMNGELEVLTTDRTNPLWRTRENQIAISYKEMYDDVVTSGISYETLVKYKEAENYVGIRTSWGSTPFSKEAFSAYDFFINGQYSYDAQSYAQQAYFDALGFNTAVVHSPSSGFISFLIVELDGKWFKYNSLEKYDFSSKDSSWTDYIIYAPSEHKEKLNFIPIIIGL